MPTAKSSPPPKLLLTTAAKTARAHAQRKRNPPARPPLQPAPTRAAPDRPPHQRPLRPPHPHRYFAQCRTKQTGRPPALRMARLPLAQHQYAQRKFPHSSSSCNAAAASGWTNTNSNACANTCAKPAKAIWKKRSSENVRLMIQFHPNIPLGTRS